MARSKAKVQVMVGIPETSQLLAHLRQEAKEQGVKLPTYLFLLLQDRDNALYGDGKNIWFPRNALSETPTAKMPVVKAKIDKVLEAFGGEDD